MDLFALFVLVACVPVFLFVRRFRRMLKIGPIYQAVLTVPIVLILWLVVQFMVDLGRP